MVQELLVKHRHLPFGHDGNGKLRQRRTQRRVCGADLAAKDGHVLAGGSGVDAKAQRMVRIVSEPGHDQPIFATGDSPVSALGYTMRP